MGLKRSSVHKGITQQVYKCLIFTCYKRQLSSLKVVGLAEQTISCAGKESNEISEAKLSMFNRKVYIEAMELI
jgi:hypothetical protein